MTTDETSRIRTGLERIEERVRTVEITLSRLVVSIQGDGGPSLYEAMREARNSAEQACRQVERFESRLRAIYWAIGVIVAAAGFIAAAAWNMVGGGG